MKISAIFLLVFSFNTYAIGALSIEGEYRCNDCHGYLSIKKTKPDLYRVWLGIGNGSCGGDVFLDKRLQLTNPKQFQVKRLDKGKACTTTISLNGMAANISDSCISQEDEASTTCAITGSYTK